MSARVLVLLLLPACAACQLIDPESGLTDNEGTGARDASHMDASAGDVSSGDARAGDAVCANTGASFCDDFERDAAIPPGDTFWHSVVCDPVASLGVSQGSLKIGYPANDGGTYDSCYLLSNTTQTINQFQLDFDLTVDQTSVTDANKATVVVVAFVLLTLPMANDAGIGNENFQLLIDGYGGGQLLALPYYPNATLSPMPGNQFPAYHLGAIYPSDGIVWIPANTKCHIEVRVDTTAPSGTATAACGGGAPVALTAKDEMPPRGISAPAALSVGYSHSAGDPPVPEWSLDYENLVFQWTATPP